MSFAVWAVLLLLPCCPAANSVHNLRPSDIGAVLAIGDSITAGFGAHGILGTNYEYRGESWSIGGDDGAITLPNLLRQSGNGGVFGASVGSHVSHFCKGVNCSSHLDPKQDVLNAAVSGAKIHSLPSEVGYLAAQLRRNSSLQQTWKLLTLFIGANDLCSGCGKKGTTPQQWELQLEQTLKSIQQQIPRVLVSVVPMFNLSMVYSISSKSFSCMPVRTMGEQECPCVMSPKAAGAKMRKLTEKLTVDFNHRTQQVVKRWGQLKNDTFAVVMQPFTLDDVTADLSSDFISSLDCFHPSLKLHQTLAVALWNSLLTPINDKKTHINSQDKPMPISDKTLIYTNFNSQ